MNNAVTSFGDRCARREVIPACSCQRFISATEHPCLKWLRSCRDAHTAPAAAVWGGRLGPAFVEMALAPRVFTCTFCCWGSAQAQTFPFALPFPTCPPAFPAIHDSVIDGGQDLTLFSKLLNFGAAGMPLAQLCGTTLAKQGAKLPKPCLSTCL